MIWFKQNAAGSPRGGRQWAAGPETTAGYEGRRVPDKEPPSDLWAVRGSSSQAGNHVVGKRWIDTPQDPTPGLRRQLVPGREPCGE